MKERQLLSPNGQINKKTTSSKDITNEKRSEPCQQLLTRKEETKETLKNFARVVQHLTNPTLDKKNIKSNMSITKAENTTRNVLKTNLTILAVMVIVIKIFTWCNFKKQIRKRKEEILITSRKESLNTHHSNTTMTLKEDFRKQLQNEKTCTTLEKTINEIKTFVSKIHQDQRQKKAMKTRSRKQCHKSFKRFATTSEEYATNTVKKNQHYANQQRNRLLSKSVTTHHFVITAIVFIFIFISETTASTENKQHKYETKFLFLKGWSPTMNENPKEQLCETTFIEEKTIQNFIFYSISFISLSLLTVAIIDVFIKHLKITKEITSKKNKTSISYTNKQQIVTILQTPIFNGKDLNFKTFIDHLETNSATLNYTEEEKIIFLALRLSGKAATCLLNIVQTQPSIHWKETIKMMNEIYNGKAKEDISMDALHNLKQSDFKTMEAYARKIQKYVNKLFSSKLGFSEQFRNRQQIKYFINGSDNLSQHLLQGKSESFSCLQEMINEAIKIQTIKEEHSRQISEIQDVTDNKEKTEDNKRHTKINMNNFRKTNWSISQHLLTQVIFILCSLSSITAQEDFDKQIFNKHHKNEHQETTDNTMTTIIISCLIILLTTIIIMFFERKKKRNIKEDATQVKTIKQITNDSKEPDLLHKDNESWPEITKTTPNINDNTVIKEKNTCIKSKVDIHTVLLTIQRLPKLHDKPPIIPMHEYENFVSIFMRKLTELKTTNILKEDEEIELFVSSLHKDFQNQLRKAEYGNCKTVTEIIEASKSFLMKLHHNQTRKEDFFKMRPVKQYQQTCDNFARRTHDYYMNLFNNDSRFGKVLVEKEIIRSFVNGLPINLRTQLQDQKFYNLYAAVEAAETAERNFFIYNQRSQMFQPRHNHNHQQQRSQEQTRIISQRRNVSPIYYLTILTIFTCVLPLTTAYHMDIAANTGNENMNKIVVSHILNMTYKVPTTNNYWSKNFFNNKTNIGTHFKTTHFTSVVPKTVEFIKNNWIILIIISIMSLIIVRNYNQKRHLSQTLEARSSKILNITAKFVMTDLQKNISLQQRTQQDIQSPVSAYTNKNKSTTKESTFFPTHQQQQINSNMIQI